MSLWAGIDIGTSGVKLALFDEDETLLADASRALEVSRPHIGWSEQHPDIWWDAVCACFDELASAQPTLMARVAAIGLSGQMLGPVLLDESQRPLRPTILWNDQRAIEECAELLERCPDIGLRGCSAPDPGFGAPKLLWLARHEPEVMAAARLLLLPKDFIRLRLTGEVATDPSDAGGSLLMDCGRRQWDAEICEVAGWDLERVPPVVDSWEAAGQLRAELAQRWELPAAIPVAAGAGDNMACSVGVGAAKSGDVAITVGTSGVICAVDEAFHPAPEQAVFTSIHATPDQYLSMGVVMSATASLDWIAGLTGVSAADLAGEAEKLMATEAWKTAPLMRPSLSGVRTPQDRPDAGGILDGLSHKTDRAALGYAMLEGVAFQFAECAAAQKAAGVQFEVLRMVGGGSRSELWGRLIATLFGGPLVIPEGAALAANRGAARLGRAAAGGGPAILSRQPPVERVVEPFEAEQPVLEERYRRYLELPINALPGAGAAV